jgi:hypothetical protein
LIYSPGSSWQPRDGLRPCDANIPFVALVKRSVVT